MVSDSAEGCTGLLRASSKQPGATLLKYSAEEAEARDDSDCSMP